MDPASAADGSSGTDGPLSAAGDAPPRVASAFRPIPRPIVRRSLRAGLIVAAVCLLPVAIDGAVRGNVLRVVAVAAAFLPFAALMAVSVGWLLLFAWARADLRKAQRGPVGDSDTFLGDGDPGPFVGPHRGGAGDEAFDDRWPKGVRTRVHLMIATIPGVLYASVALHPHILAADLTPETQLGIAAVALLFSGLAYLLLGRLFPRA